MTNAVMPDPLIVQSNGIPMAVYTAGTGPTVVLLHGFPELAFSWRHQFSALVEQGWRVIAPDLRGYGGTGCHGAIEDYRFGNLALDVLGVLDALKIDRAALVGHDFGGALAWAIARDFPARFAGIASLNTPYTRRGSADLPSTVERQLGPTNYMVVFQKPGVGEALLERDIAATFDGLMRRPALSLQGFRALGPEYQALPVTLFLGERSVMGEPIMDQEDLAVFIAAFSKNGFEGPLNWYRAMHRNWLDTANSKDRVDIPALMVSAADDYYLPPETTRGMEAHVPDLERALIADCGHWTQHERPDETNLILIEWLNRRIKPLLA